MITTLFTMITGITSVAFLLIMMGIGVALYIWQSLEMYWLYQMCSYDNAWMAWIPVLRYYALAEVTGNADGTTTLYLIGKSIPTDWFRFWPVLTLILFKSSSIGGVLKVLLTVLCLGTSLTTVYSKFENKTTDEVKVLGYLSGWIPLVGTIKLTQYKHRQMFY